MRTRDFDRLMSQIARATPAQLQTAQQRLAELNSASSALLIAEERLSKSHCCPHCGGVRFMRWGKTAAGAQRYRCRNCAKSFAALTGTVFSRLHRKARLIENAHLMRGFLSVRKVAKQLGVHRNTAFRYRHLMMPELAQHQPSGLEGVAGADEMFYRRSFKGQKKALPRAAHKRGSPAKKRGLSAEQVPVLTVLSRGSKQAFIEVLPAPASATMLEKLLGPALNPDAVLCTDSASAYRTAGKALGILVRQIPSGSHKLGPYHIQNANALHSRLKGRMRPFRGVATKYLAEYLAWVRFFDRDDGPESARAFLLDAFSSKRATK